MLDVFRKRPSPAMVVAVIALFAAMAGGAYAAKKAGKNTVVTKSIKAAAVKSSKIADGAITTAKIADGAVTGSKLAAGTISGLDRCPNGAANRVGDICFGAEQGPALWDAALDDCASEGLRVPGIGEGFLVLTALPNNTDMWSDEVGDLSANPSLRIFVRREAGGTLEPFSISNATPKTYRCVATPTN